MYQKPEVRIIDHQQVESNPIEATSAEAAALLAKYGYKNPQQVYQPDQPIQTQQSRGLTADELYAMQLREEEERRNREYQRLYGPKAMTFDSNKINYSNVEYRDLGIDGQNVGIQVQIVSDMPIYNNNNRR
jgi:hypothetical protein